MKLTGKVAVVTGGAGGIGGATIQTLAKEGAKVVISDINWDGAKKLEESLSKKGVSALAVKTDIGIYQQVKELTEKTLKAFGRIDVLVNNAGMPSAKKEGKKVELWETSVETWERVIDVDLNGYFYCCREMVPHMIPNGWGRIVNISSQAARTGGASAGADYTAAKAGVIGMTKALASQVGKYGITVNAITPGRIDTQLIRIVPPEVNAEFVKKTPLGRLGTTEDVAGAIMFLISDAASFITGATIDVNGGLAMY
jgi:3-oxoacyl-[acyl-carrier protein] reductase